MRLDDILIQTGEFGRYQRFQYFLVCLTAVTCAFQVLSGVYITATPKHRCRLPNWPNDTYKIQSQEHQREIDQWIPSGDSCHQFSNRTTVNNTRKVYCGDSNGWVFDHTDFEDSFVSQFQLVCQQNYWPSIISTSLLAGVMVGTIFFGWLSDKFGRKKTIITANLLMCIFGIAAALVSNPYALSVAKFLIGWASSGVFPVAFVLGMEIVGPNMRFHAGMIIEYAFAVGLVLLAAIAFMTRYWRWLQLALSLPLLTYISFWWLMPESARWLISRNRFDEADKIINKMVDINGGIYEDKSIIVNEVNPDDANEANVVAQESLLDYFKSKTLLLRSTIIWLQWFVIAMVYYGLSFNTGSLPGNVYVNSLMSGAVEIPGYLIAHITINRYGRRWPHILSMIFGGVACGSTLFLIMFTEPSNNTKTSSKRHEKISELKRDKYLLATDSANWAFILLTMTGKMLLTTAFATIYLWSAELIPTSTRNIGLGMASFFGRVGTLLAPTIGRLQEFIDSKYGAALPLMIFGGLSIVGGGLAILLPETLGESLPETIYEGEIFGTDSYHDLKRNHEIKEGPDNEAFERSGL